MENRQLIKRIEKPYLQDFIVREVRGFVPSFFKSQKSMEIHWEWTCYDCCIWMHPFQFDVSLLQC